MVGVCVVVAALFGFMALNRGPGSSSEAEGSKAPTTVASTSTSTTEDSGAPTVTAAPMPAAVPTTEAPPQPNGPVDGIESEVPPSADLAPPVDTARFCAGAQGITPFEGALAGAFAAQDLDGVRRAVADNRASWTAAVADLVEAGPPQNRVQFERYRDVYLWVLGMVDTDGNLERIGNGYPPEYRDRAANPNDPIAAAVAAHCG